MTQNCVKGDLLPVKGDLLPDKNIFFMCDIQERFRPAIHNFDAVVENARRLATASNVLKRPLIVTEQYPKGLGKTISDIPIDEAVGIFEKTKFSMIIPEVDKYIEGEPDLKQAIVFGVETHVCVQQTVLDLLKRGFEVFLVADATSSRSETDRGLALQRLRDAGAIVSTTESILFQLIADKDHDHFKVIQSLVKDQVDFK